MKEKFMDDLLHSLINKKIQIFYVGADQEETSAQGRLLEVTNDTIKIEGAITTVILIRKQISITAVDYVEGSDRSNDVKIWIHNRGYKKFNGAVLSKIGRLVEKGKTRGSNEPIGFDWELDEFSPIKQVLPKQVNYQ